MLEYISSFLSYEQRIQLARVNRFFYQLHKEYINKTSLIESYVLNMPTDIDKDLRKVQYNCYLVLSNGNIAIARTTFAPDFTIKIYSPTKNTVIAELRGHTETITCLSEISPNVIASGSKDTTIKIWNVANCKELKTLKYSSLAIDAILALSKEILLIRTFWEIDIWDIKANAGKNSILNHQNHSYPSKLAKLSEKQFAVIGHDNITLYHIKYGICAQENFTAPIITCALSLSSKFIITGHENGTLKLWQFDIQKKWVNTKIHPVKELTGHTEKVTDLALLPSGEIISISNDKSLRVWDIKAGLCTKILAQDKTITKFFGLLDKKTLLADFDGNTTDSILKINMPVLFNKPKLM